ncbi:type II pantothenate kinase [Clostridia bacterium]|nr:type II pantothenate kinase [Clostridia bacterium]
MVIGIDMGISRNKIVAADGTKIVSSFVLPKSEHIELSLSENFNLSEIEKIVLTGIMSEKIKHDMCNIPTTRISEFLCNARGALFLAKRERALVMSIGTGTSIIKADGDDIAHMGGTGVGGGTITGLGKRMLGISDFSALSKLSAAGNLRHIDLTIGDVTTDIITTLQPDLTASNFANINSDAFPADCALGIFNLVYQTVGMMAVFASRTSGIKDVILIGGGADTPQAALLLKDFKHFDIKFICVPNAVFATALGACLLFEKF